MTRRLQLREILLSMAPRIYFQPPPTKKIEYPCIIYGRDSNDTIFADDIPFRVLPRWWITVIDTDPDSEIPDKVAEIPTCISDRFYTSENLNHWSFNLYF